MINNFTKSNQLLSDALKIIPLASQTFSKSKIQFPENVSPYFIDKASGSKIWDVDGNKYLDMVSSLAAISLGYTYKEVDDVVKNQIDRGVIFSLSNPLEIKLANKIKSLKPSMEMIRFGKNGSDATSAAVRAARAFTKKDLIVVCGYHGWHDWYIGSTTRNLGVPQAVQNLTLKFEYNNIDSLQKIFDEHKNNIAAVIMEPMNVSYPKDNFLHKVKDLAHKNNALLIFDETVTGFRFSKGGAQEYFDIYPDITTIGKGMANGYPISAIGGSVKIMKIFEDIFFSGTFGGDCVAMSAALKTLEIIDKNNVPNFLEKQGNKIIKSLQNLISDQNLEDIINISGHPSWSFTIFKDNKKYSALEIKTLFMQEMIKRGVLTFGTHNLNYSHLDQDISDLLLVYKEVLSIIRLAINNSNLHSLLKCKVLEPLFKVR